MFGDVWAMELQLGLQAESFAHTRRSYIQEQQYSRTYSRTRLVLEIETHGQNNYANYFVTREQNKMPFEKKSVSLTTQTRQSAVANVCFDRAKRTFENVKRVFCRSETYVLKRGT